MRTDEHKTAGRWRFIAWSAAAAFVFLPLLAVQIAGGAGVDGSTLARATALVVAVGAIYEATVRVSARFAYRLGIGQALATGTFLVWVNLAVGIIGSEDNPANRIFLAVLAVLALGSLASLSRARGMAWTLAATAVAQAMVGVVAWAAGWGFIIPITVLFVALWLSSAAMFRKAPAAEFARPAGLATPRTIEGGEE